MNRNMTFGYTEICAIQTDWIMIVYILIIDTWSHPGAWPWGLDIPYQAYCERDIINQSAL